MTELEIVAELIGQELVIDIYKQGTDERPDFVAPVVVRIERLAEAA